MREGRKQHFTISKNALTGGEQFAIDNNVLASRKNYFTIDNNLCSQVDAWIHVAYMVPVNVDQVLN